MRSEKADEQSAPVLLLRFYNKIKDKSEIKVNQKIRIKLKAYDHRVLDRSVKEIVDTVQRTGARIAGPVPLPTQDKQDNCAQVPPC